jgi:LysR family glycine cleavage system transcriptional activator
MSRPLPHLLWIRTFDACARHMSFAGAAEELALTPAAVGQHMRHLEFQLGFALFERLPRGIRLTGIGRAYAPMVAGLLNDFSASTVALFGMQGETAVTLRCVASFAGLRLPGILHAFGQAYPAIRVQVHTSIWNDDPDNARADLDIRYGNGLWPQHDVIALSQGLSYPLCPPGSTFGDDPGNALRTMALGAPIQILGMENLWRKLGHLLGWPDDEMQARCTVDTSAIALELVAAGAGCAIIDAQLCRLHLERGWVVRPPDIVLHHDQRHYILVPRTRTVTRPEVIILRDWIRTMVQNGGISDP